MKKARVNISIELSEIYDESQRVDLLRRILDYMFRGRYAMKINGKVLK